jgi:uncharacterized membrane protein YhaH (DUF805 family)
MTGRIFINYRRGDSSGAAGRIYDRLLQHFGRDELFMDVDALEPGIDFVKSLDEQVSNCRAFITVIGPNWLHAQDRDGNSRLNNPNDYVRVEIEAALKRDVRLIPVLVEGATMPQPTDLPGSLKALARRNAVEISHHRFSADCDELARAIKRALGVKIDESPGAQAASASKAIAVNRDLSWADILFSFQGRISALQFAIGYACIIALFFALLVPIMLTVDQSFGDGTYFGEGADQSPELRHKFAMFDKRLPTILGVMLWWPTWALTLKRLHDFGLGWNILLFFVALDVTSAVLDFTDKNDLSWQLQLFGMGLGFMLSAVKGTNGPNVYGPEPPPAFELTFSDLINARAPSAALSWAIAYLASNVVVLGLIGYLLDSLKLTDLQIALITLPCVVIILFFAWFHFHRFISQRFFAAGFLITLSCTVHAALLSVSIFHVSSAMTGEVRIITRIAPALLIPLSIFYALWRMWQARRR